MPGDLAGELGAPEFQVRARLADGSERMRPQYRAGVEIVGLRPIFMVRLIRLGDECLMGQGIISQLKVTFDHGREVVVEP